MKALTLIPLLFLVACTSTVKRNQFPKTTGFTFNKDNITPTPENIGIPEQIKTYQIGRYIDPADPDTMHERHTLYRREQTGHWNLASSSGVGASRSYYLTADKSQQGEQQRLYYEAAQEQARLAQEKLASAEQKIVVLEKENLALQEKTRPSPLYPPNLKQHE